MTDRLKIAYALRDWIAENFPFGTYVFHHGDTKLTNCYFVSVWYNSKSEGDISIAQIVLSENEIYFRYGANRHLKWPNEMTLTYEDPKLIYIIEDKLSKIEI